MDMFDFAGMLFGGSRTAPDAKTVTATGAGASDGGEVGITLDADVTPAEDTGVEGDTDQTIIDLPTSPDVDEGDEVIVTLVGDGPLKTPVVTANPGSGDRMRALANSAKAVADAAQAVADAVSQHFWTDDSGAHVTEATQDEWQQSHSGPNSLWNSLGMLFRNGLTNLLAVLTNGVAIYDGNGNDESNIVASFSASETHIGRGGEGSVYLANDAFAMTASSSTDELDPELTVSTADMRIDDANESYEFGAGIKVSTHKHESAAASNLVDVTTEVSIDQNMGTYVQPVSKAGVSSTAYADGSDSTTLVYADHVELNADSASYRDPYDANEHLQLGNPTYYQDSGSYAITTAGVTSLHNGPRITIPAGSYIFVGAWTFNTGSSSGQRNLQLGFRSGASGDIWGERVRIMAAANNYAILNVSALRTFDAQTTVYLAGSSSMTSGSASAWITAVRLN